MAWPPYSPDLNPIESVWDKLKEYISTYRQEYVTNYELLRTIVYDAWQSVDVEFLERQLNPMREGCEAVIQANGTHTRF